MPFLSVDNALYDSDVDAEKALMLRANGESGESELRYEVVACKVRAFCRRKSLAYSETESAVRSDLEQFGTTCSPSLHLPCCRFLLDHE